MDHSKAADNILAAFNGKGDTAAGSTDEAEPTAEADAEAKGGSLGKVAMAAIKHGDAEAFEQAIRDICS